jgi:hypothetical protein
MNALREWLDAVRPSVQPSPLARAMTRRRDPLATDDPVENLRINMPQEPARFGAALTNRQPDTVDGVRPMFGLPQQAPVVTPQEEARTRMMADALMGASGTIRAFHGSPHRFDRFSMDRIGTGEGAQAYGHGLYFAGNEGVARSYRDQLAGLAGPPIFRGQRAAIGDIDHAVMAAGRNVAQSMPQARLDFFSTNLVEAARNGQSLDEIVALARTPGERVAAAEMLKVAREVSPSPPGHMYEVRLNTTPERLLDWDAPLAANHPAREVISNVARPVTEGGYGEARSRAYDALMAARNPNLTGNGAYVQTSRVLGNPAASAEALRNAGIDGIQYLDAGSRAAGEGSRNYVMFNDAQIEILRRYGILPPAVGAGAAVATGEEQ